MSHRSIRIHIQTIERYDEVESVTMATMLISIIKLIEREENQMAVNCTVTFGNDVMSSLHTNSDQLDDVL